jgi:hypothetical protein
MTADILGSAPIPVGSFQQIVLHVSAPTSCATREVGEVMFRLDANAPWLLPTAHDLQYGSIHRLPVDGADLLLVNRSKCEWSYILAGVQ